MTHACHEPRKNALFRLRALLAAKMSQDVLWNLASLAIIGIGGILFNVLVARWYGAATLGVFNQVFSAYIVFSQFAAGGVHLSALRAVAQLAEDRGNRRASITAAVLLSAALAIAFAIVFWWLRTPIAWLLESPGVSVGMAWAAPGLFCFAVNKTLLGVLNGLRRMRWYATVQALRLLLMFGALLLLNRGGYGGDYVPFVLSVAEGAVAVLLIALVLPEMGASSVARLRIWIRRHFHFGLRSAGSGVLLEFNTRVDVLMLGYLCSDALVGAYSFAAVLVEGLAQIPVVLRTNINPVLALHLKQRDEPSLRRLVRTTRVGSLALMTVIGAAAAGCYPVVVHLLTGQDEFTHTWAIFGILTAGLVLGSPWIPLNQILLQGGRPGAHTLMSLGSVAANVVLNALLIPWAGGLGAALATAASFVISAVLVRVLATRLLGVRL